MKKLAYISLLVSLYTTACSKSDDPQPSKPKKSFALLDAVTLNGAENGPFTTRYFFNSDSTLNNLQLNGAGPIPYVYGLYFKYNPVNQLNYSLEYNTSPVDTTRNLDFSYDNKGLLTKVVFGNGKSGFLYEYNSKGQVTKVHYLLQDVETGVATLQYDNGGNLVKKEQIDAGGGKLKITYRYDDKFNAWASLGTGYLLANQLFYNLGPNNLIEVLVTDDLGILISKDVHSYTYSSNNYPLADKVLHVNNKIDTSYIDYSFSYK
ncbi:hypothetical protein ACE38W_10350 [Chitinophaga sp. Hz27]|uniref:hypothetical protein n=1 Tax=Chitinophaga sp. Hz27 TaxID=3347169 RepID=UPI0035DA1F03